MEDIYPCACGGGKVEGGRAKRAKQGEREREKRREEEEMVEACAAEYFHTEVNNTPRYPGQGWPTTPLPPEILSFFRGGKLLFFLFKLERNSKGVV